jgi:Ca2+-binding RTX toxin-like protein
MARSGKRTLALVPSLVLVAAVLFVPSASARAVTCFGERATIVGTRGNDVIVGTKRADVIAGLAGNDTIRGGGKGDIICGGKGNDRLDGEKGIDLLLGGQGNDKLTGGPGAYNQIWPGPGDDVVDGGPRDGDEVIYLDATGDLVGDVATGTMTGHGDDRIRNTEWWIGGQGNDTITGTDDVDVMFGAGGNDVLDVGGGDFNAVAGGEGDDQIIGGPGVDYLDEYFAADYYFGAGPEGPFTIDLQAQTFTGYGNDVISAIDGASGSRGDDTMTGNASDNEFTGLHEGNDTVNAGAGDDLVDGGDGADHLDGGPGRDLLGNLNASAGMTIDLGMNTTSHQDVLAGFEDVLGTFFDDTIKGDAGTNELAGSWGADQLFGLAGDDTIFGDWTDFQSAEDADSADGGDGTDACDAETVVNCEGVPPAPADAMSSMQLARAAYARFGYARLVR